VIDDETARLMFNVILVMTLATVGDQTRRPIVLQVRIQSDYVSRRVCRAWSAIGFMVNRIGSYSTQERLFSVFYPNGILNGCRPLEASTPLSLQAQRAQHTITTINILPHSDQPTQLTLCAAPVFHRDVVDTTLLPLDLPC